MKPIVFATVIATLALVGTGHATNRKPAEEARREVLATDDARIKARAAGDLRTMSRIYADDYTLVTAEGALRKKGDQISEMRTGQLQFQPVELFERSVRVYDGTAIVLSHERAVITRNGKDIGGDFRANRVYVERPGGWQLVLTQVTRIAP